MYAVASEFRSKRQSSDLAKEGMLAGGAEAQAQGTCVEGGVELNAITEQERFASAQSQGARTYETLTVPDSLSLFLISPDWGTISQR